MKKLYVFCALTMLLASCNTDNYTFHDGAAEGTTYHIIANNAPEDIDARIAAVFEHIDSTLSIFNPDSQVSRVNRNEEVKIDTGFYMCVAYTRLATQISKGTYDITAKPLVEAWGFGTASQTGVEPTAEQVDSILQFVGLDKYSLGYGRVFKKDPRVQFDLSSVAKGYSVDIMCDMLDAEGVEDYLVEIGGEVRCKGKNGRGGLWRVGIDNPEFRGIEGESQIQESLGVSGVAVATSGNYRQFYTSDNGRNVGHTINAVTGYPVQTPILSVTVVTDYCGRADAFATMIMSLGDMETVKKAAKTFEPYGDMYILYRDEDNKVQVFKTAGMSKYIPE